MVPAEVLAAPIPAEASERQGLRPPLKTILLGSQGSAGVGGGYLDNATTLSHEMSFSSQVPPQWSQQMCIPS